MNKLDIINTLKKYNLDKNEYIVISGAAMVLYGIKEETSDIDIAVTKKYNKYLIDNFDYETEKESVYYIDGVINFSTNYYSRDKRYIDDIPVQKINHILNLKLSLNREKDKVDIEKIKEYLDE